MASHPELFADGLIFPEGLRWHDDALWFSDAFGASVWRASVAGDKQLVVEFDGQPSGLGFLPDGTLLVVDMGGGRVLRIDDGRPSAGITVKVAAPQVAMNQ